MRLNDGEYVSVAEYSTKVGISRVAAFKRIKTGKLEAFKAGRNYLIKIK